MARRPNRKTGGREIPIKQVNEFSMFGDELLKQRIAKKAYELYECRGCCHGRDLDDLARGGAIGFSRHSRRTKKITGSS